MRILAVFCAVLLCMYCAIGIAQAQGSLLMQQLEILDPTLSASVVASQQSGECIAIPFETWQTPAGSVACSAWGTSLGTAVAADGTVIRWFEDNQGSDPACPVLQRNAVRVLVTRPGGIAREAVRVYTFRGFTCGASDCGTRFSGTARVIYDVTNGVLFIDRVLTLSDCATSQYLADDRGVVAVAGFPSLLDVILSYQPPAILSFKVPVHPEGLPGVNSFSVYSGNARKASDLSLAVPVQCSLPTGRAPIPGETLTVLDPLPDPIVGQGRYYVATPSFQGQRRAGQIQIDGVLRGRNVATLPMCQ